MAAIGPVGRKARELHAAHHPDDPGVSCYGCRMAASYLIEGRVYAFPRARRSGEQVLTVAADALSTAEHGRIVQTPGHRGYLRSTELTAKGNVHVATTSGVAVYPPNQPFSVWGP